MLPTSSVTGSDLPVGELACPVRVLFPIYFDVHFVQRVHRTVFLGWIELQIPGAETMIVLHKEPGHVPGDTPGLSFVADNVQTTYDELKAKGVEFLQPPKKEHWGEHAIFKDSEGNSVIFTKG